MTMNARNASPIMFSQARTAVGNLLGSFDKPAELLGSAMRIDGEVRRAGVDAVDALIERLNDPDPMPRLLAAWKLWTAPAWKLGLVDAAARTRVESIIVDAVRSGSENERLFACTLMIEAPPPQAAQPDLRAGLDSDDGRVQVYAAAALASLGEDDAEVLRILRGGLKHEWVVLRAAAARGMLWLKKDDRPCINTLARCLREARGGERTAILSFVGAAEIVGDGLRKALRTIASSASEQVVNRQSALVLLGRYEVAKEPLIRSALTGRNPALVSGSLRALAAARNVPPAWSKEIGRLLGSPNEEVRLAASAALAKMGPSALPALPRVIERFGQEQSENEIDGLARAIAAMGTKTVPALIEVARAHDVRRMPTIAQAMKKMGVDGVRAWTEAIVRESDDWVFTALLILVRDLGREAAPAVPMFAELLDTHEDEALALFLTGAIFVTGQHGLPAVPALLRRLRAAEGELLDAIERTLWFMGPQAVPLVEAEMSKATGDHRQKLGRMLAGMGSVDDARFVRCRKLDESDVQLFVWCMEAIAQHAEPSSRALARALFQMRLSELIPKSQPVSQASIVRLNKTLYKKLGIKIITGTRRGRGQLSDDARSFYREASEYLRLQAAKRGDGIRA